MKNSSNNIETELKYSGDFLEDIFKLLLNSLETSLKHLRFNLKTLETPLKLI